MKQLLLLLPLLFAQSTPSFLDGTKLPPQFTLTFSNVILCEVAKPSPAVNNKLFYLETPQGVLYMKSFFAQSALIPGAPIRFKDTAVWWFLVPDPAHGNLYTARVYSEQKKEWALVAVNVGPLRRDLVARYYAYLPKAPASAPPMPPVPVGNPPNVQVAWFYTSGSESKPAPPGSNPGFFAMLVDRATYTPYRKPYSFAGGGAGAMHQAYGQLVYQAFNLSPQLTPASFTPPSGYKQIGMSEKPMTNHGYPTPTFNCPVCHETNPKEPVTLYQPVEKAIDCPAKK